MKKEKGITLVALILTIVILLILAVVTINSIQGEGIISKAMQAREDYEDAAKKEQGMLDQYLEDMEGITSGTSQGGNSGENGSGTESNIASTTEEGVPIPRGFKYVEGTKDTGVVIEDETTGSQFVWVPVTSTITSYGLGTTNIREPDVVTQEYYSISGSGSYINGADNNTKYLNIINNILGTNYTTSDDFLRDLQTDFNAMAESVNKNDGFYVGRYETSLNNGRAQSLYGKTSANASASSANTWYGLYAYQKAVYNNDSYSVQSTMIWGSQYDAMMTWMGDVANTSIGDKRNTTRITGSIETDKIKNVYDLCGNSFEWTLEAQQTDARVFRGGRHDADTEASSKWGGHSMPIDTYGDVGSRLALYIK